MKSGQRREPKLYELQDVQFQPWKRVKQSRPI